MNNKKLKLKKFFAVSLATMLMLTITPASVYAATATKASYVCPNGYEDCVTNGACLDNGVCISHEDCVKNSVCLYPKSCPNGGVAKREATRHSEKNGHHSERGRGHHGGSRCR